MFKCFRGLPTLLLVALSIGGGSLFAQSTTQTIQGLVTDSTGAVIPGASVSITNTATGVQNFAETGASGNYTFALVSVGNYDVRCEAAGFKVEIATGLRVETGGQVRQDFALQIGEVTETVEVSAAAVTLQTENAITGSVVENKRVIELPLNGRNIVNLAVLTPGVQFGNRTGRADGQGGFPIPGQAYSVSANGQREIHQVVSLDGVDAKDPRIHIANFVPSIEAIEEFKIQTNSYSAEFGWGGGAVTNITMKSGTNEIHGTLFNFLRNDKLDAEDYFLNFELAPGVDRAPKDPLRRNQYGFVVSGPIVKNKTFWAVNHEGRRQRESRPQTAWFPEAAFRSGDFSELLTGTVNPANGNLFRDPIVLFDAFTGDPYANNVLPQSQINQGVIGVQNSFIPNADFRQDDPLDFTNRGAINQPINTNQWFGRVDHIFGANNRIFGRIAYDKSNFDQVQINPNFPRFLNSDVTNTAFQWIKTITPTTINELRFGFNFSNNDTTHPRTNDESFNMDALGLGQVRVAGDGNRPLTPREHGIMDLNGIGPGLTLRELTGGNGFDFLDTYQLGDHVSMIRGKHNLKMGFEWYHIRIQRAAANLARGRYRFSGNEAGFSYASFLLGRLERSETAEGLPGTFPHVNRMGGYINDDWKVSNKLTVNLGLRYDYNGYPVDTQGLQRTIDFPGQSLVDGRGQGYTTPDGRVIPTIFPEFVDERGAVKTMKQVTGRFFMPRAGIAYRLNSKTVLRTGAGWFDNLDHQNTWTILNLMPPKSGSQQIRVQTQNARLIDVTGADGQAYTIPTRQYVPGSSILTLDDPYLANSGGPTGTRPAVNVLHTPQDRQDGAVWKWSFDIQRELPNKVIATVGYVGSKGTHVGSSVRNFNNAVTPSMDDFTQDKRVFPEFYDAATPELGIQQTGIIRYLDSFGETFHHGLQFKVERRYSNGLAGGLSYTYSKSHGDGENGGQEGAAFSNPFDRRASRGLFRFDQKHNMVANFVWELPGNNLPGALKYALGGWQANGILSLRSGFAFNQGLGGDPLNLGRGSEQRPDRIADGRLDNPTRKLAFDTTAFTRVTCDRPDRPELCRFGNSAYNPLRQLWGQTFDFSLYKNIPIKDQMRVQFRAEMFNATNTPYFGNPIGMGFSGTNDTDGNTNARAGEIRSLNTDMRTIQLALKFFF